MPRVNRRDFFIGSAAAGAATAWGQRKNQAKLERIAVMSYSFDSIIQWGAYADDPGRTIDILDFPDMIAHRYGVQHVEIQHTHFRSTEPIYLQEFRHRLQRANSQMTQLVLELGALNISSPDPVLRLETVDLTKQWIDHAVTLGCPRVMVNQGTLAPAVRQTAIETLQKINAYAKTRKVWVTMENRDDPPGEGGRAAAGASAADWRDEYEVIRATGTWANPDPGGFPDNAARWAGLRALYPLSSGSSHLQYNPKRWNQATVFQIAKEAGYKGLFSIEAVPEVNGSDPYQAVQSILDEYLRDIVVG
jgi:sugar phosphate isomerase/epimerase